MDDDDLPDTKPELPGLIRMLRDKSRSDEWDEVPTMECCPRCNGLGEIRVEEEPHGGRYGIVFAECSVCAGEGMVPFVVARSWIIANRVDVSR